ncbi:MAG: hypothetical protein HGB32_15070 [Geobacteraceae bacterium]|nr:hypothetical protein [Geobacteraceae bacterium]NTW81445.1 hypothetical protein [Geobacteraceae bacterium]
MNRLIAVLCKSLILAVLMQPFTAFAVEEATINCTIERPYTGEQFVGLYKNTEWVSKIFCEELIRSRIGKGVFDNARIASVLSDFSVQSKKVLDDLKLDKSADYKVQFDALRRTFEQFDSMKVVLPEFKSQSSISDGGGIGFFEPLEEVTNRFVIKEVEHCATVAQGSTCKAIFEDFEKAFNPYRSVYDNVYGKNSELLAKMGKEWDTFLEVSKSQTALEVWLTTLINSNHFKKDYLVGPPSYQVIALHPQLVYDRLENAPDGSKQEMGLAVEWAGVNFWDLRIPLGISIASVYVDRANIKDVGLGAMLHINNHYAIGWANYGNANSVYVTIDLLKMFEDKKSKYDEYVEKYL